MPNALAGENSPYLLQHAANPVEWLPWGEAAFAKARTERKPIFLSIGYATCHWCHVMAHESFENPDIAVLLNASFVPVKVDREERPDVDKVYMTYVQAMTGHGGWPLSAWLTPELKPFFGGTYFPPEDRGGHAGFGSVLRAIAHGWATERERLVNEGDRVIGALREHFAGSNPPGGAAAEGRPLVEAAAGAFEKTFQQLYESFDPDRGGFGGAPKFPRAGNLNLLFRIAVLQGENSEAGAEAVRMAATTCRAMIQGGLHDHVGGGFHRYSVDAGWFLPHFEKMLYDQAQLAINLIEAKQATGDERFGWAAREVFEYVLRDLTSPEGAFYSAEDADSPVPDYPERHAEGAFYLWSQAELEAALGPDAPLFSVHFGTTAEGNVPSELDPHGEFSGRNLLAQRQPLADTARAAGLGLKEASDALRRALDALRTIRARRPRPLRDDKVIAAWNGLMISSLARAHAVLGRDSSIADGGPDHLAAAVRAAAFVQRELYDGERRVLHRSWRGRRGPEGFASDYACMIRGLLDLYEAGFDERWLRWAEELQHSMDERFWDEAAGGYFDAAAGDPAIVLRLKEDYDGAEPAASSVAAANLLRLGAMLDHGGAGGYRQRGLRCLEAFRDRWAATPHALPEMLCALELALIEPAHLVLAGDPASAGFRALVDVVHERLRPRMGLLAVTGAVDHWLAQRAPWTAGMEPREGHPRAYVCRDFACQAPVESAEELRALLANWEGTERTTPARES